MKISVTGIVVPELYRSMPGFDSNTWLKKYPGWWNDPVYFLKFQSEEPLSKEQMASIFDVDILNISETLYETLYETCKYEINIACPKMKVPFDKIDNVLELLL